MFSNPLMQTEPAPLSNHGEGNARLLIIEPNRNAMSVLAKRLGDAGYRVIACEEVANAPAEGHAPTSLSVTARGGRRAAAESVRLPQQACRTLPKPFLQLEGIFFTPRFTLFASPQPDGPLR